MNCETCNDSGWWTDAEPSMNPDGSPDFAHPIPIQVACDCAEGKLWEERSRIKPEEETKTNGDVPF